MVMLVTIEEAAAHLKLDDYSAEEADLTLKIQAASGAVLDFLDLDEDAYQVPAEPEDYEYDYSGYVQEAPAQVKAAVLLLIADMHRHRGTADAKPVESHYAGLPGPVQALLFPLKDLVF